MFQIIICGVLLFCAVICTAQSGSKKGKVVLESLTDIKDFKKLVKSKTNVLVCFGNGKASFTKDGVLNVLTEAAQEVKGLGTVAVADCSGYVFKSLLNFHKIISKIFFNVSPSNIFNYSNLMVYRETKKKLCKKAKVLPDEGQFILKHYHNGDFNKDYDRAIRVSSFVNFMRDPTGDLPWDEDDTAKDVVHVTDGTVKYFIFMYSCYKKK